MLSTEKYRRCWKQINRELEFRPILVMLASADLNVVRVRVRVSKGGHNGPEPETRERWGKSLRQLPWLLNHADKAGRFDNTGAVPQLIGNQQNGVMAIDPNAPGARRETFNLIGAVEG